MEQNTNNIVVNAIKLAIKDSVKQMQNDVNEAFESILHDIDTNVGLKNNTAQVTSSIISEADTIELPSIPEATKKKEVVAAIYNDHSQREEKTKKSNEDFFSPMQLKSRVMLNSTCTIIDNVLAAKNSRKKRISFREFMLKYNFSTLMASYKYYNFKCFKNLYTAYTGLELPDSLTSLTCLYKEESIFKDMSLYYYNNDEYYTLDSINRFRLNYTHNDKSINIKSNIPTIKDFLLYDVDTEKVISKNMTFDDILQEYNDTYNASISKKSLRNTFTANQICIKDFPDAGNESKAISCMIKKLRDRSLEKVMNTATKNTVPNVKITKKTSKKDALTSTIADRIKGHLGI